MGGKGSEGPSNLQMEAYENFGQYGSQYDDISQVPRYGEWSAANPSLISAAERGFGEGNAARARQNQMESLLEMLQRPQEIASKEAYQTRHYGILADPTATFEQITESDLRTQRQGTKDESGYDDFAGALAEQYGEGFGYVYDPEHSIMGARDRVGGTGQGAWRAIGQEEFATLAADRTGTMEAYGGLVDSSGNEVWAGWEEAIKGEGLRDQAIVDYTEALRYATDTVNSMISQERQNALLMGVDYNITDESKTQRISNQLATDDRWTSSMQTDLDQLIADYGAGDFVQDIFRGEKGGAANPPPKAGTTKVRLGAGATALTEEDEVLGTTSLLGV